MRILHAIHAWVPEAFGGTQFYLRDLVNTQRAQGLEVSVLTGSMEPWPEVGREDVEICNVPVWRIHRDDRFFDHHAKIWHPTVERVVRELLAELRPDLLHVHHWLMLTCNLIELASEAGIPSIVTLHDAYVTCPRCYRVDRDENHCTRPFSLENCLPCVPRYGHESDAEVAAGIDLFAREFRSELTAARAILVASSAAADLISAQTGIPRDRFTVVPFGHRRSSTRRTPPERNNDHVTRFGYWGMISRRKGIPVLLEAFEEVARECPGAAELHLFGSFETEEMKRFTRAAAARLPIRIHAGCSLDELAGSRLDAAIFPSICYETFGFVLSECFELGLPSIVTEVGAFPERTGHSALTVPPGDSRAMAAAIRKLLLEPDARRALAARIPPLPADYPTHAEILLRCYRDVLAAGAGRRPGVSAGERAGFLLRQRESALVSLHERGPR